MRAEVIDEDEKHVFKESGDAQNKEKWPGRAGKARLRRTTDAEAMRLDCFLV